MRDRGGRKRRRVPEGDFREKYPQARLAPSIAQLSFTLYDVDAAANLEFAEACHHAPYDAPPRHAPHIHMPRSTKSPYAAPPARRSFLSSATSSGTS